MGAYIENYLGVVSRMVVQLPASISVLAGCSGGRSSVRPAAFFEKPKGVMAVAMTNAGIRRYSSFFIVSFFRR